MDDVIYDPVRGKILVATLGRGIWSIDAPLLVADVANSAGQGVPDGAIDESDLTAFAGWTAGTDVENADPDEPDQQADVGGDGEVSVEDQILFMKAYVEGW